MKLSASQSSAKSTYTGRLARPLKITPYALPHVLLLTVPLMAKGPKR